MTSCARCGHELGIGRFCLNCGHPVGAPVPASEALVLDDVRPTSTDRDTPSGHGAGRPTWLPWAVGAAVLLLLGAIIIATSLLGDDDAGPDTATEPTRATSGGADPAAAPARAVVLTRKAQISAPAAAPPTTDLDGQLVGYGQGRMLDGDPATAWRTAGDATGQIITFSLPRASTVRRVGLVNGYARRVLDGASLVDWYPNNRRITVVEWVFDDGTVVRQELREKSTMQRLTIEPVTTTDVHLRLLGVTPPGAGVLGRDYTAISEVLIAGTPAG